MKKIYQLLLTILMTHSLILSFAQDVIYKIDGAEIKAKITDITTETIKYKKYEQQDGPIRNILISDVFMVIYEDGTREVFKDESNTSEDKQVKRDNKIEEIACIIKDKRDNTLIIGEVSHPLRLLIWPMFFVHKKVKDKHNVVFPFVNRIFLERLEKKGFASYEKEGGYEVKKETFPYALDINVKRTLF